jgi:hypothetical protein
VCCTCRHLVFDVCSPQRFAVGGQVSEAAELLQSCNPSALQLEITQRSWCRPHADRSEQFDTREPVLI